GPASDLVRIAGRFCASDGSSCPIFSGDSASWSTCTDARPACAGVDAPNGSVHDCTGRDGALYREVLTLYLSGPTTTCGNGVCEGAPAGAVLGPGATVEDAVNCPSDCHPGTWAKSFNIYTTAGTGPIADYFKLAVASLEDNFYFAANTPDPGVDLGGGPLTGLTQLARYSPAGAYVGFVP